VARQTRLVAGGWYKSVRWMLRRGGDGWQGAEVCGRGGWPPGVAGHGNGRSGLGKVRYDPTDKYAVALLL